MKSVTIVVLLMPSKCTGCKRHWELELTKIYLCHWGVNNSCKVIKVFVPCIFPLIFAIGSFWSGPFFTWQLGPRKWYKASKEAFSFKKKYIILDSRHFIQKIPLTTSADGILLLNNETLADSKIEGHRERLEHQQTRNSGKRQKGKNMKNTNVWNRDQQRIWQ